jgi:hypothetical protein
MATATPRNRFLPDPVVVMTVVAGLLFGLAALCCCCVDGHTRTHEPAHTAAAAPSILLDTASDVVMAGDPSDQHAGGGGDGCDHPAQDTVAVVASGSLVSRDLAPAPTAGIDRPNPAPARAAAAVGSTAARAPATHLLCILRT